MRKSNRKKYMLLLLFVLLSVGLLGGMTLGRYAGEWKHSFGLSILPVNNIDYSLKRYFRSNELLPVSENAAYTVKGTSAWFTVANALDTNTVSKDEINYTLTWYVSVDGDTWTEHKEERGIFAADKYEKAKYTVEPLTLNGTVYNNVKVHGETSSFLQEDIEAVYNFTYSNYSEEITYSNGVITIKIDTNDMSGDYKFTWPAGIVPDNSDANKIFTNASKGSSELTVTLNKDTAYEFLFFVTDDTLLDGSSDAKDIISITKK